VQPGVPIELGFPLELSRSRARPRDGLGDAKRHGECGASVREGLRPARTERPRCGAASGRGLSTFGRVAPRGGSAEGGESRIAGRVREGSRRRGGECVLLSGTGRAPRSGAQRKPTQCRCECCRAVQAVGGQGNRIKCITRRRPTPSAGIRRATPQAGACSSRRASFRRARRELP
jgi:hypothetical protein